MIAVLKKNGLTIVLMILSLGFYGCDTEPDPKEHLQKGIEYLQKGDYDKARLELKTSRQADKDTADSYYYLALLDEKSNNIKAMRENLLKAIELEPNHLDARIKLGNLHLVLGETGQVREQLDYLTKNFPKNVDVNLFRASYLFKEDRLDEALAVVGNLLVEHPDSPQATALKSAIYLKKGDAETAIALIDKAIAADPKNIAFHLLRVQTHAGKSDQNAVFADYQKLIEQFPDNKEFRVLLAKEYVRASKFKEAEEVLQAIVDRHPNDIRAKLLFLEFMLAKPGIDNKQLVKQRFDQYVLQHKKQPAALLALANWMAGKKDYQESNAVLDKILQSNSDKKVALAAKKQLVANALSENNVDKAAQLVDKMLVEHDGTDEVKVLNALILVTKNKNQEALALLGKLELVQPNSEQIRLLTARAHLQKGDRPLAYKHFIRTLALNPVNQEALAHVYSMALEKNDLQLAKDMLDNALKRLPGNLILMERLGRVNILEKNWAEVEAMVNTLANQANPLANNLATFLKAEALLGQQSYQQAMQLYKELLINSPTNQNLLKSLAAAHEGLGKRPEMIAYLHESLKKEPKNPAAMLLLANLYWADKKAEPAAAALKRLIESYPRHIGAHIMLANIKSAQNEHTAAMDVLRQGIDKNPANTSLQLTLASVYERQNDWDSALGIYRQLLETNPNLAIAANNLAALLTDHYDDPAKHHEAVRLSERFKNHAQPALRDTYGWALIKSGRTQEGVDVLRQVVADAPDVPIFRYHLAYGLYRNHEHGSAISEIKQTIELAKLQNMVPIQEQAKKLLEEITAHDKS